MCNQESAMLYYFAFLMHLKIVFSSVPIVITSSGKEFKIARFLNILLSRKTTIPLSVAFLISPPNPYLRVGMARGS